MRIMDFSYDLPRELIAQFPAGERTASRLLYLESVTGARRDLTFAQLPQLLTTGDLLIFNDTRVMRARLAGSKPTGGKVEVLVERVLEERRILARVRSSKPLRIGGEIRLAERAGQAQGAIVLAQAGELFELGLTGPRNAWELMAVTGTLPLPPYIRRPPQTLDEERYQTIYACKPGAVAAPTAGLHFDQPLLERLQQMGVRYAYITLHVGSGTFQPVRVEHLEDHRMHREYLEVSKEVCAQVKDTRARGKRVIAVGTTSMRALETASQGGEIQPYQGESELFIYPGYRFRCVDALITNFHLPASTLLVLVCAFAGQKRVLDAYRHAVQQRYRFFSYGDAMFLASEMTGEKPCVPFRNAGR
jgi:S-adenosylmethionine:tRNA ribosyltransferase-isomerase